MMPTNQFDFVNWLITNLNQKDSNWFGFFFFSSLWYD